jgi:hypothetical protein
MSCAQCRHENHPDASFCDKCGYPLLHLWPRAEPSPRPTPAHGRPRRPPPRLIEAVAAIGIVVTGLSVISGIVVASPHWQRIIASWRESLVARSASVRPVTVTPTETTEPAAHNATVPWRIARLSGDRTRRGGRHPAAGNSPQRARGSAGNRRLCSQAAGSSPGADAVRGGPSSVGLGAGDGHPARLAARPGPGVADGAGQRGCSFA